MAGAAVLHHQTALLPADAVACPQSPASPLMQTFELTPPPRLSQSCAYSRLIWHAKRLCLVAALVCALTIAVIAEHATPPSTFMPLETAARIGPVPAMEMTVPVAQGVTPSGYPYTLTATRSVRRSHKIPVVLLSDPRGDIEMSDGSWLMLSAKNGRLNIADSSLHLLSDVFLYHDGGYEISTHDLTVDLGQRSAQSQTAVTGQGPAGTFKAEGLALRNSGERIELLGASSVTFTADRLPSLAQRPTPPRQRFIPTPLSKGGG